MKKLLLAAIFTAAVFATILLKAGLHPLRIFYRHGAGRVNLDLKFSGPDLAKQPVPSTAFASDGSNQNWPPFRREWVVARNHPR
jgi:hypothetical protein